MTGADGRVCIALLRGINVGGRRRVPMADLRALCTDSGGTDVESYIASGNLVFGTRRAPAEFEAALEERIEARFGFAVPVIVRSAGQWSQFARSNPFPDAARDAPSRLMLGLAKSPLAGDVQALLVERVTAPEQVARVAEALWIHYAEGLARSKLTPAALDRAAGSPMTTRNWRTVIELAAMVTERMQR